MLDTDTDLMKALLYVFLIMQKRNLVHPYKLVKAHLPGGGSVRHKASQSGPQDQPSGSLQETLCGVITHTHQTGIQTEVPVNTGTDLLQESQSRKKSPHGAWTCIWREALCCAVTWRTCLCLCVSGRVFCCCCCCSWQAFVIFWVQEENCGTTDQRWPWTMTPWTPWSDATRIRTCLVFKQVTHTTTHTPVIQKN